MVKKILLFTTILLVGFVASFFIFNSFTNKIKGNGDVNSQEREVSDFKKIKIDGVFNVHIKQGDVNQVIVETDSNLQESVVVENEGETLVLKSIFKIKNTTKMIIHVTFKEVNYIRHNGVGNLKTTELIKVDNIEFDINSVGNAKFDIKANEILLRSTGVGNVEMMGSAKYMDVLSSGVGNVRARDLVVAKLKLESKGVGNVKVNITDSLSIIKKGVGNVTYYGNPVVASLQIKGVGKVNKAK